MFQPTEPLARSLHSHFLTHWSLYSIKKLSFLKSTSGMARSGEPSLAVPGVVFGVCQEWGEQREENITEMGRCSSQAKDRNASLQHREREGGPVLPSPRQSPLGQCAQHSQPPRVVFLQKDRFLRQTNSLNPSCNLQLSNVFIQDSVFRMIFVPLIKSFSLHYDCALWGLTFILALLCRGYDTFERL